MFTFGPGGGREGGEARRRKQRERVIGQEERKKKGMSGENKGRRVKRQMKRGMEKKENEMGEMEREENVQKYLYG